MSSSGFDRRGYRDNTLLPPGGEASHSLSLRRSSAVQ